MKRRSDVEQDKGLDREHHRSLKRANSSLFSIATIVDGGDGLDGIASTCSSVPSADPCVGRPHLNDVVARSNAQSTCREQCSEPSSSQEAMEGKSSTIGTSSAVDDTAGSGNDGDAQSPISSSTSTSSSNGFFIEDDDENDVGDIGNTRQPERVCLKSLADAHANTVATADGSTHDAAMRVTAATALTAEPRIDNATGIVFEVAELHYDRHNRLHKERPLRITSIRDHFMNSDHNLAERCILFGEKSKDNNRSGPSKETISFLDDEDYLRVHLPGYMQRLDQLMGCTCTDRLDCEAEQYKSMYFTSDTVAAAKNAAASLCQMVANVVDGELDNGFAVIRPPGHHSEPGLAGGYCVINNVAVAAAYAREKLGLSKVLIVDYDVHHGNGTQSIFLSDPSVLYFSVHRYHNGNFFPFLSSGGPAVVGNGEAAGRNVNVGWNQKGQGDEEYCAVWQTLLMPVAKEFQPDLVLISAGFDGALGDMGECCVTPACFSRLTTDLMSLAGGRVVCTLEGGYVRSVLGKCVEAVVVALLGSSSTKKENASGQADAALCSICPSAAKSIRSTIEAHAPYWKCLN